MRAIPTRTVVTADDEDRAARCRQGRVVVIDDDPEILLALGALIEFEGYASDTFSSAQAYLAELEAGTAQFPGPTCVLCDVNMPLLSGLELQQRLNPCDTVPWLLMSGGSGAREATSAFLAGAVDFLIKPLETEPLLLAIARALDLSASRQQEQAQLADLCARAVTLTDREAEVLHRVVQGMTNPVIAVELGIALRTVKLHRQRGMEKLGVDATAHLVRQMDRLARRPPSP